MQIYNFNQCKLKTKQGQSQAIGDYGLDTGSTLVFFRNLEAELVKLINRADLVVGCVAWLTSENVLTALAAVPTGVAVVVQKEAYIKSGSKAHKLYSRLPAPPPPAFFNGLASRIATPSFEAVRCIGQYHSGKTGYPRMHNKFLVFCRAHRFAIQPYQVWTGSFNFTANATRSFENAVVLSNRKIAQAYYQEWSQIMALSESLNWESNRMDPQWVLE